MARNMTKTNTEAFNHMKAFVGKYEYSEFQDKICIITTDDEKDWLQEAKPTVEGNTNDFIIKKALNKIAITEIFYKEERYVAIKGISETSEDNDYITSVDINAGIFTLLLSIDFIKPINNKETAFSLYDTVLYHEDNTVRKIAFEEIDEKFESVFIFRVNKEIESNIRTEQILGYLILNAEQHKISNNDLLINLQSILLEGHGSIPYDLINRGIINLDNLRIIFLDLYRCIERLFAIPTIIKLKEKLGLSLSDWETIKHLEAATGWRQTEHVGLNNLIKSLPINDIDEAIQYLQNTSLATNLDEIILNEKRLATLKQNSEIHNTEIEILKISLSESKSKLISSRIYKTRNSFVHYRPIFDDYVLDDDLPNLCCCLISLINPIYNAMNISE